MKKNTDLGTLMQMAKLLIVDEVTMFAYDTIDRTLQEVRNEKSVPFGGLTVVFAGDWRQILPVVPRGSRADIVNSTLKRSRRLRTD